MLQAFVIVLREGFESFLIAAIMLSYLRKSGRVGLSSAVYLGAGFSVLASAALAFVLIKGVNTPLWEGILGLVTIGLVGWLIVHMWRTAPRLKRDMESKLKGLSAKGSARLAFLGVFFFTAVNITREGMETALFLIQVRSMPQYVTGILLGLLATVAMCWAWVRFSKLINLKRFFQVTSVFLALFLVQIAIYSLHEFTEAGIFPQSEAWHLATEPYSPDGLYGKWFSLFSIALAAGWLLVAGLVDKSKRKNPTLLHPPQRAIGSH